MYNWNTRFKNMSTNISKQKRNDLINKIKLIKNHIAKEKQDKNAGNLLTYLSELEKEINGKKYGLVFEEHEEEIDLKLKTHTPVLSEEKDLFIDNGRQMNFLIEGDNLPALKLLKKTHKGKIDVVYIDPPYNTGAKDWKYDNDYVDENDTFRHSKWLSFINKRLIIARQLLSDRGVLVITIDDNEQEALGLLLHEQFSDKQITCVTIVHNPAGVQGQNFSPSHEYAYFVYPKGGRYIGYQKRADKDADVRNFRDVTGESSLRTAAKNCFYPINVKNGSIISFGDVCSPNFHPISVNTSNEDGTISIYPIDPQGIERKWRFARHTVDSIASQLRVKFIKARKVWDIVRVKNTFNYKTVWYDSKYSANNHGTQLVNKILQNGAFQFPKSIYAVIDCIDAALKNKKNGLILDFFAGSGTTGHAVMKLNKEDGGNRRFILCTNNENNICRDVTYERIKRVIDKENYQESLKYFKVDFISIEKQFYYEYADKLLKHIRELVELENGINFEENNKIKIILTDIELTEFLENINEIKKCQKLYLGHDVLLSGIQEKLFKDNEIEINVIPDYYYKELES